MVAVSLSGYIFFGSSVRIVDKVLEIANACLPAHTDPLPAPSASTLPPRPPPRPKAPTPHPLSPKAFLDTATELQFPDDEELEQSAPLTPRSPLAEPRRNGPAGPPAAAASDASGAVAAAAGPGQDLVRRLSDRQGLGDLFKEADRGRAELALQAAPRFLLLDFRRVAGVDATAARTFATLASQLHNMGIELILAHLPARRCAALPSCFVSLLPLCLI